MSNSERVTVTFYYLNGERDRQVTYPNVTDAFNACIASHQDALAHPEGTTCGGYEWRAGQGGHTLEGFKDKMALCCNCPSEYSARLHKAGYF